MSTPPVRLLPFGGVGEFGKNMMIYALGRDAIMVDCGIGFPEPGQPGVDVVIPDIAALEDLGLVLQAVVLTHGHEDHIGALPYLFPRLNCPIYGTEMTLALVGEKLSDSGITGAELKSIREGESLPIGPFKIEAIPVTHSIMDAVSLAIDTPYGVIIHTGDFKIDPSPIDGRVTNLNRFAALGDQGVALLVSDSTNATREGSGPSERTVGAGLRQAVQSCQKGKVVVTTFSSNMFRIQQILDVARCCDRKVALAGRSLMRNAEIAIKLNRLRVEPGQIVSVKEVVKLPASQILIIAAGSQGEPRAALGRIAKGQFPNVTLQQDDLVVFSSSVIPGNERAIFGLFNHIYRRGARVLHAGQAPMHVSGHAHARELKMMIQLTQPGYFYPVHGEYRYLIEHKRLALSMRIPEQNTLVAENGQSIELDADGVRLGETFPAGAVFVDGGISDGIDQLILRDRRRLAEEGIVTAIVTLSRQEGRLIGTPELAARGFMQADQGEGMMKQAATELKAHLEARGQEFLADENAAKEDIRIELRRIFKRLTGRRPMVVPVVLGV